MKRATDPSEQAVLHECRRILEHNSKSFALAARLLSPEARDRAAAVYAFCRRADDAIDQAPATAQAAALEQLQLELARLYEGEAFSEPALRAFRAVITQSNMPLCYPRELIEGMAMDVRNTPYETLDDLLLYCHRVAGVVGLMMCHVLGLTRDSALRNAAHLGIAMQLTNICRDVEEDWQLGRLYLPRRMVASAGAAALPQVVSGPFPREPQTIHAMQAVMHALLSEADGYYASAMKGIDALPLREGLAIRAAGRIYQAIGQVIARRAYDPRRGRAVVARSSKLLCIGRASFEHLQTLPTAVLTRIKTGSGVRTPTKELSFSEATLAS